jgi:hypothetical protein
MANSCLAFKGLATLISRKSDVDVVYVNFRGLNRGPVQAAADGVMFTRIDLDGRSLTFEPVVRPVIALKGGAARGVAIDRALKSDDGPKPAGAALARLSEYDAQELDRALLTAGLAAVGEAEAHDKALFAPVTFASLATPRARRDILPLLLAAQARLGAHLVVEITTLDPGLPPSRLVEVLAAIRPTCHTVFALRPERRAIKALVDCGLDGAAIEASDLDDPEDAKALTRVRLVLRAIGSRMLIHNLRSVNAINAAREAGATYGALDIAGLGGAGRGGGGEYGPHRGQDRQS